MKELLPMFIIFWFGFCILGSFFKVLPTDGENSCGKTYPIDYIIYTNLFCEVKD